MDVDTKCTDVPCTSHQVSVRRGAPSLSSPSTPPASPTRPGEKARTRALRRKRLAAIIMPWHFSRYRAEIAEIKEERRKAKAEEKARKKPLPKSEKWLARKLTRSELRSESKQQRKSALNGLPHAPRNQLKNLLRKLPRSSNRRGRGQKLYG